MPEFTLPAGTLIRTVDHRHESSAKVIVVGTAAGTLYVKGPPTAEGNAMLLREWAGTKLAEAFGLQTLDYGLMGMPLSEGDPDVALFDGSSLRRDVVFASRREAGAAWEGGPEQLDVVGNSSAFSRLTVFDTWVRNRDRYYEGVNGRAHANTGNVFISDNRARGPRPLLLAIDHTHVFGSDAVIDAGAGSAGIADETVYGLFPLFRRHVNVRDVQAALVCLAKMSHEAVLSLVQDTPCVWGMDAGRANNLTYFLVARARFLCAAGPGRFL